MGRSAAWRGGGVLVAILLIGVGCGRTGDRDAVPELTTVGAADLVDATEGSGSFRFRSELDASVGGEETDGWSGPAWQLTSSTEGVADPGRRMSDSTTRVESGVAAVEGAVDEVGRPPAMQIDRRSVGADAWSRTTTIGGEPGPWVVDQPFDEIIEEIIGEEDDVVVDDDGVIVEGEGPIDEAEDDVVKSFDGSPLDGLASGSVDPTEILGLLRDQVGPLSEVGSEDLDGVRTTRYEVTVDPAEVDDHGELWSEDEDHGLVEVWVDDEQRLRRVEAGGLTVELWDFGVAVDVSPPDDVVEADAGPWADAALAFPTVTGEWAPVSSGTIDGRGWTVFAAPARHQEVEVTCRTFEVDGLEGPVPPGEGEAFGLVTRDGTMASCGRTAASSFEGPVADPAVQVLDPGGTGSDPPLVALVVSERFRDTPVRVVAGDDVLELPLDAAGIATWDGQGLSSAPTALELDGGAVRCPIAPFASALLALSQTLGPCVSS